MNIIDPFKNLSQNQKGAILMIAGTILLFNTLGILTRWLDTLIIIGSLYMIVYGFFMTGYHEKIVQNR